MKVKYQVIFNKKKKECVQVYKFINFITNQVSSNRKADATAHVQNMLPHYDRRDMVERYASSHTVLTLLNH